MSNGFHEIQFPTDLSYGFSGGPIFDVDITATKSKLEQRIIQKNMKNIKGY